MDLEAKDKNGKTPLDYACAQGELSCVECLMHYGADCEARDTLTARTPIHSAAYTNNEDCLRAICMAYNARIRKTTKLNSTFDSSAYDDASIYFNTKLTNVRDMRGRTPLMLAVEQGHLNTISFLVAQMGANVLACDDKNRTALHRAVGTFK